jgi:hypothetical protein
MTVVRLSRNEATRLRVLSGVGRRQTYPPDAFSARGPEGLNNGLHRRRVSNPTIWLQTGVVAIEFRCALL